MGFYKSNAVADLLGIGYYRLFDLIRTRKITPPAKDTSGDYVWTPADIDSARKALASGRRPRQEAAPAGGPAR